MKELFWADQIAKQIVERMEREGREPNIKCQQTPSGAKHIGNLNDVVRAYFPSKALHERGVKHTFVHTTDDRDPLKDVPFKMLDLDGKWHKASSLPEMKKYLGMPLCRVPDPFGCCNSWSEHFTKAWMDGVYMLGMKPDLYSVNDLYSQGKMTKYVRMIFEKIDVAGRIVAKHQKTKDTDYIPFDAICQNCGRLTPINSFDLDSMAVHYACGGKAIKKKKTEGCGHSGEALIADGKLQWRFEWPALMALFGTTYEPFGKDHAEGSWKTAVDVMKDILEIEPPIPYVYEFFLVNGGKMSASVGNVYVVQDILEIMEPEVFLFFYTKRPGRQRNLDLKQLHLMVEDFEHAERVYFEIDKEKNETDRNNLVRSYKMCMAELPEKPPVRIPYQFAALIGQVHADGIENALELLKFTGHLQRNETSLRSSKATPLTDVGKINEDEKERVRKRLMFARNWAQKYAPEEFKIKVNEKPPEVELRDNEANAFRALAKEISKDMGEKELQSRIFDISREHNVEAKRFFQLAYRILINKDSGPRLGPFIVALGRERVRKMLESI